MLQFIPLISKQIQSHANFSNYRVTLQVMQTSVYRSLSKSLHLLISIALSRITIAFTITVLMKEHISFPTLLFHTILINFIAVSSALTLICGICYVVLMLSLKLLLSALHILLVNEPNSQQFFQPHSNFENDANNCVLLQITMCYSVQIPTISLDC